MPVYANGLGGSSIFFFRNLRSSSFLLSLRSPEDDQWQIYMQGKGGYCPS
jgi:hypothetical protein